jgi:mRNA interferase MazF
MARYVRDAGDIVWLESDAQAGREQVAHRPALALNPATSLLRPVSRRVPS